MPFLITSGLVFFPLYVYGCYDYRHIINRYYILAYCSLGAMSAFLIYITAGYLLNIEKSGLFGRGILIGASVLFLLFLVVNRLIVRRRILNIFKNVIWYFSADEKVEQFIADDLKKIAVPYKNLKFIQPNSLATELDTIEKKNSVLVLALHSTEVDEVLMNKLVDLRVRGHLILGLIEFYEQSWKKVPVYFLSHNWFIYSKGFQLLGGRNNQFIKRLIDIFLSTILLILTWPIMLITSLAIKLTSKGDVLYSQIRTGKDNVNFKIYKFRSMAQDAEKDGAQWAAKSDPRITTVGKIIRLTRIDELPQLINVFRGEMSFIGPRPERPEFNKDLEKVIPFYSMRHTVPPGLTGLAQVLYPYGASVEDSKEKLQFDLFYIKNYSLLLDFFILLKTIRVVLFGKGR